MTKTSDLPSTLSRVPLTCLKPVRPTCKNLCNSFKNLNLDKPAALKRPVTSTCKNLCNSFKTLILDKPVRSTCKDWYETFKNLNLGKAAAARKEFLGFVTIRSMVFSMVFDLQGIRNNDDFVDPSIKLLSNVKMSHVFHCNGLLLCLTKDHSRILVWNPYLGQMTWFKPINKTLVRKYYRRSYKYTLGYDTNNHIHKIFRLSLNGGGRAIEIYYFNSNSWKVLDLAVEHTLWCNECEAVSLKGNTFFLAGKIEIKVYLLCLDVAVKRFGPRLPLPFRSIDDDFDILNLSSVRDEQLAMLHQHFVSRMVEIWITTKIEPNDISWSKFLKVDMKPRVVDGFPVNARVIEDETHMLRSIKSI